MKFNPDLPLEEAWTIPNDWYHSPEIYEKEKKKIFSDWQCVGRLDQLKENNYFTCTVADEPIVVVREEQIKAFYNVCRHKAAQVVCGTGTVSKLRCPYHGWTYDLNGELRGAPEFGKEICREQFNLPELEVATFGNLIFVKDKSVKGLNIINFMSPVDNVPDYTFYARKTYELRCNWKVYVDNYLDGGYHVNYIHPGLAEVVDYKHYHTKLYDNTNVQISPLNAGSSTRKGTAYYWWIFPNLMINIYDGVMDTNHVFPLSPDRCLVAMDFYFQDMSPFQRSESIGIADKIQDEDVKICENVQLGLKSRSYESGRFCVKREAGAYHFHKLLSRKLYG